MPQAPPASGAHRVGTARPCARVCIGGKQARRVGFQEFLLADRGIFGSLLSAFYTQAAENHQAVINAASHLFREHGLDGIGLKDLMKGAGLTQGGFYKQFASKKDLMAQASGRAIEAAVLRWSRALDARRGDGLDTIIQFYLSAEHRDNKGEGCPFVALAGDAARQGPQIKAQFEDGLRAHLQMLGGVFAQADIPDPNQPPQGTAMAVVSLLVGSVLLSRTVNDPALSQDILDAAAAAARDIAPA